MLHVFGVQFPVILFGSFCSFFLLDFEIDVNGSGSVSGVHDNAGNSANVSGGPRRGSGCLLEPTLSAPHF